MITTSKTENDKKGGQISIVKSPTYNYVTIVEKAQAEESNQLHYFEELGLRSTDRPSLFNTNIVIINQAALKKRLLRFPKMNDENFLNCFSPDVIKNIKAQGNKSFTQLESALGSVVLNLDRYFRENYQEKLIHFLNLTPADRTKFFLPIKSRKDYDDFCTNFIVSSDSIRLVKSK